MTDRWNPPRRTVVVEKPTNTIIVPGDVPPSSPVVPMGKTWGMRVRGDVDGKVVHEYECPVHGRFTVQVPRSAVPDEVACGRPIAAEPIMLLGVLSADFHCAELATWCGSSCGIGHAAGEVMS